MTIADEKYIALTTFKRDGTPVTTPVWIAPLSEANTAGFWTSSGSGKAKRIGHTTRVTLQACDARGRASADAPVIDATAELASAGPVFDEIKRAIVAKYGFMTKITKVLGSIGGIIKRNRIPYGDRCVIIALPPEA
ncbi:MAG TPA: PPOX class F420-dependent oxidoreductase [Ilumatobacter sp.]|nr:PPOX class F420-dependent oxidoreductase [Ilumatobacter sp.]